MLIWTVLDLTGPGPNTFILSNTLLYLLEIARLRVDRHGWGEKLHFQNPDMLDC